MRILHRGLLQSLIFGGTHCFQRACQPSFYYTRKRKQKPSISSDQQCGEPSTSTTKSVSCHLCDGPGTAFPNANDMSDLLSNGLELHVPGGITLALQTSGNSGSIVSTCTCSVRARKTETRHVLIDRQSFDYWNRTPGEGPRRTRRAAFHQTISKPHFEPSNSRRNWEMLRR